MAKSLLPLTLAVAEFPHTKAILSGRIPIEGIEPHFANVQTADRRLSADGAGGGVRHLRTGADHLYHCPCACAPFTALRSRVARFHHGGIMVRPDAGITSPKDLEGKKVGVRAYSVTTGVWTRASDDEYGLDPARR